MVDYKEKKSSVVNSRRGIDHKTGWSAGVKETIKDKMDQAMKDEPIEGVSKATRDRIREQITRYKSSGASWGEIQELIITLLKADGAKKEQVATVSNPKAEKYYRDMIEVDGAFLGIKPISQKKYMNYKRNK